MSNLRGLCSVARSALGWLVFPVVPTLLGMAYHKGLNSESADPRDWDGLAWAVQLGPLVGFGFLVGLTTVAPEPEWEGRGWVRRLLGSRWLVVGVSPWLGFLCWLLLLLIVEQITKGREEGFLTDIDVPAWLLYAIGYGLVLPTLAYGWTFFAIGPLRRARRLGSLGKCLGRGIATALTFVGTLFGGFWAATSVWRSYFFDPTIAPIVLFVAGVAIVGSTGCASTTTLGEVRRRELFDAMLPAWLIGLAIIWRWSSRRDRAA